MTNLRQIRVYSEGFFIAAALTMYDSNTDVVEEARYGELTFNHNIWGVVDKAIQDDSKPLESHFCSDEELGFSPGPLTVMFPIKK